MLAQPVTRALSSARSILLAGCGGGYDVLGAVPLLAELVEQGRQVHLASLSFCYLNGLARAKQVDTHPNLYEVPGEAATPKAYCPEAWLARWMKERLGLAKPVWGLDKTGVRPLLAAYRHLVVTLAIDALVLVDGGIDSLLRGDETSLGTPAEDLASLAAAHALELPTKILSCVGLGAEMRDGICHEQVFERISGIARSGGHLGTAALIAGTRAADHYRDAVEYVFENQKEQRRSHVHEVVLAAMRGEAGTPAPNVWLSPLSSQVWFFDLDSVARSHLFLSALADTDSIWEVNARIEAARKDLTIRAKSGIPL